MRGYVYILSNQAIPKLLKIGYTTRTVEDRIIEITTTGVPGRFIAEFFCEVNDAHHLEKVVHAKLSSKRYDKEFFKCDIQLAVEVIKEAILEHSISLYGSGGRNSQAYLTSGEIREIKNTEDRKKSSERLAAQQKSIRDAKVKPLIQKFMKAAPGVDRIIQEKKVGGLREAASFLAALTGIGLIFVEKISPRPEVDGARIAKTLNAYERRIIMEFKLLISELRSLSALDEAFGEYKNKYGFEKCFLVSTNGCGGSSYGISGWLQGLFSEI